MVNDVLNDVFVRCVCERQDVKSQDHSCVLLEKTPLAATQAFSLQTHAGPIFFEHPNGCLSASKMSAILRDWHELDAERAVS